MCGARKRSKMKISCCDDEHLFLFCALCSKSYSRRAHDDHMNTTNTKTNTQREKRAELIQMNKKDELV